MRKLLFVLTLLFIAAFPLRFVLADDSEFGGYGANIYPLQNSEIKLEYEWLTLDNLSYSKQASVEAIFFFKNGGGEKTITVGFPEALDSNPDDPHATISDFKTWVDGKPVDTVYQPLKKHNDPYEFDRAYLWKLHFKRGETHVVKNTYRLSPSVTSMGDWTFTYILKTGALWAGKIGKIDIVVKSPVRVPWMTYLPYPEEYSQFHAVEWEPDRDIVVKSYIQNDVALQNKGVMPKDFSGYFDDPRKPMKIYQDAAQKHRVLIRNYIARLDDDALETATQKELQLYINGIYATYGRPFKEKSWADYFGKKWWYEAKKEYSEKMLSKEDLGAVERLKRYLK